MVWTYQLNMAVDIDGPGTSQEHLTC